MNAKIRHLNIEVTKRCNQRCFYCFNNSGIGSPASEFTPKQWLEIIQKLRNAGLKSVHVTGGEPFAYRGAVELLAGAQGMGLRTSILTNGFRVAELARLYPHVFCNLDVAQVSLDSTQPELHNRRRGHPRAWDDAVSAIRDLRHMGVPVEISCVLSEENKGSIIGASLLLRPLQSLGRAKVTTPHTCMDFSQMLDACLPVPVVHDRYYYVADDRGHWPEGCPKDFITVHHDGKLRTHGLLNLPRTVQELA
jgi:MoaA/NifB/PqqE/SkfB family radical SAM enzyme